MIYVKNPQDAHAKELSLENCSKKKLLLNNKHLPVIHRHTFGSIQMSFVILLSETDVMHKKKFR